MTDLRTQIKICPACERAFHNRKKWQARGLWPAIVYCSKRCRQEHARQRRNSS